MRAPHLLLGLVLLLTPRVEAYIEALMSLDHILEESSSVLVGRIESVDLEKRTAVARIEKPLKGPGEYERVQMNIGAGPRVQGTFILELLEKDDPFILFYKRSGGTIQSVAHAGNYWFQLFADHANDDRRVWWRFTHIEIYLPRTFAGTTPELIELSRDVLSGRRRGPPAKPSTPLIDVRKLDARAARARKRGDAAGDGASRTELTLIEPGAEWRFHPGKTAPSRAEEWTTTDFDDAAFRSGRAPFGYGDPPFGTELADMQKKGRAPGYSTLYLRRRFTVPANTRIREASAVVDFDDGFVLWIDGERAAESNAPKGKLAHDARAPVDHESGTAESFDLAKVLSRLTPGEHLAAVQVFNRDLTSSDLKLELELVVTSEKASSATEGAGRFTSVFTLESPGGGEVRGVSWVDVNSDEMLDVYFSRAGGDVLLLNEGNGFSDGGRRAGVTGGSRSATWADWNGDGYPDLLTSDFRLLTNQAGRLEDASSLLAAPAGRNPEGAGWIDANGDGLPDVLITNGEHGVVLLENTGDAASPFRDVSRKAGFGPGGIGSGNGDFIACADLDGDGYTEILYNLASGVFAHNEGDGSFRANPGSGIELPGGSDQKRGLAIGDFDRDGDLDIFVPGPGHPALYRNENDGRHVNVIGRSGDLERQRAASFSAAWGDVDHDGHLDLFVAYLDGTCRLFLGDGAGGFKDATHAAGLDGVDHVSAGALADLDGDGDLDLAVNQRDRVTVYRNELRKAPGTSGLEVRLAVSRGSIGSTLRVLDARGGLLGLRQLLRAESCGGQSDPLGHVAVPEGPCRVSVVLGDGRFAEKEIAAKGERTQLVLRDGDFE